MLTVDNSPTGADEGAFRSVDLLLGALGACMVGTMLTAAEENGVTVSGVSVKLRPVVALAPERVSRIRMEMEVEGPIGDLELKLLREAAESCKVHNSLHRGVETVLNMTRVER